MDVIGPVPEACTQILQQCNAAMLHEITHNLSSSVEQQSAALAKEFRASGHELRTALRFLTGLMFASLGMLVVIFCTFILVPAWCARCLGGGRAELRARDIATVAT